MPEEVSTIEAVFASGDFDVLVVGAGLTGAVTSAVLSEAGRKILLIDSKPIGAGTPFSTEEKSDVPLGSVICSFNISEACVQRRLGLILRGLEGTELEHVDDGLLSKGRLSRTCERPQGWNRVTGQWEHYLFRADKFDFAVVVRSVLRDCDRTTVLTGYEVSSLEAVVPPAESLSERSTFVWRVGLQGCTPNHSPVIYYETSALILCLPAPAVKRLLFTLPNKECLLV